MDKSNVQWKDEYKPIVFDLWDCKQWCDFFGWDPEDIIEVDHGWGRVSVVKREVFFSKEYHAGRLATATIDIDMPNAFVAYFFPVTSHKRGAASIYYKMKD